MKSTFRQGIINYPVAGANQLFLVKNGSNINLSTSGGYTSVTFAHGSSNYYLEETADLTPAWANVPANVWIYWDIHRGTGVRTFGYTAVEPVTSSIRPISPVNDLHWYSPVASKMYVYRTNQFVEVIRVFAAFYNGATFTPYGSDANKPFAGTQVAANVSNTMGRILFQETGLPIRKPSGEFFTTDSVFFVQGARTSAVRLESDILQFEAAQSVNKFGVCKINNDSKMVLAGHQDTGTTILAIASDDLATGDVGVFIAQGVITNPNWSWTTPGAPLWVKDNGELSLTDPNTTDALTYPNPKPPIARIINNTSILFQQKW